MILGYCAEASIFSQDAESDLDANADVFARSAHQISHQPNEMISIKITGLLDMEVLKKWNREQKRVYRWWDRHSHEGYINYQGLKSAFETFSPAELV